MVFLHLALRQDLLREPPHPLRSRKFPHQPEGELHRRPRGLAGDELSRDDDPVVDVLVVGQIFPPGGVDRRTPPLHHPGLDQNRGRAADGGNVLSQLIHPADQVEDPLVLAQVNEARIASGEDDGIEILGVDLVDGGVGDDSDPVGPPDGPDLVLVGRASPPGRSISISLAEACGHHLHLGPPQDVDDRHKLDLFKALCHGNDDLQDLQPPASPDFTRSEELSASDLL